MMILTSEVACRMKYSDAAVKELELPPHKRLRVIIPPEPAPLWVNVDYMVQSVVVTITAPSMKSLIHHHVDVLIKQGMEGEFDNQLIQKVKELLANASTKEYSSVFNGICDSPLRVSSMFKLMELLRIEKYGYSKISLLNFSARFVELMFENPNLAIDILNQNQIHLLPFHDKVIARAIVLRASMGFPVNLDEAFSKCLVSFSDKFWSNCGACFLDPMETMLWTCIRHDNPITFQTILICLIKKKSELNKLKEFQDVTLKLCIDTILHWDSLECFKVICVHFKESLISNDLIVARASKCLIHLLGIDAKILAAVVDMNQMMKKASDDGYAEFVLAGCKKNYLQAAQVVFSDIMQRIQALTKNETEDKLLNEIAENCVFRLMRFSPLEIVSKLFAVFKESLGLREQKLFSESYAKAKVIALKILPFVSQYCRTRDVAAIIKKYSVIESESISQKEKEFALYCSVNVDDLLAKLKANQLVHADPTNEFAKLPKSKSGSGKAALLLEAISKTLIQKYKGRQGTDLHFFGQIRSIKFKTIVEGRYAWGTLLLNSVYYQSQAKDFVREKFGDGGFYYKNKCISRFESEVVSTDNKNPFKEHYMKWLHGRAAVAYTWGDIEDLFEELMLVKFVRPVQSVAIERDVKQNDEMLIKYKNDLVAFYKKAAKLVWLIGNTQPLNRGSGTVAEWFFGIVYRNQGINPPILKKKNPQLDVLNISYPLSDYENDKNFLSFFEQESLEECLR
jgi:hypothetical protein